MNQGSGTPKPARGSAATHCITEWSLVKEETTPKRGGQAAWEAALGGVQVSLGLELAPEKISKLLLRTQLPLLSSQDVAFFFFSFPYALFPWARRQGRDPPRSSLASLLYHCPQQSWFMKVMLPDPAVHCPSWLQSPTDPGVFPSLDEI